MSEIRSTLDMVMERAEKMCAETPEQEDQSALHAGMKLGAAYMNKQDIDLATQLSRLQGDDKHQYFQGILQTFMRNITLPHTNDSPWQTALKGIAELSSTSASERSQQVNSYLSEITNILGNYSKHKEQVRNQLEENFAAQAAQLEQNLADQTGMQMKIDPKQHPKFQEEWSKVVGQLNDQYSTAIDQYKNAITQILH